MAAGTHVRWDAPSRRGLPRYKVQAAVDVTVLRSGIPDTLPGRALNLCERGLAAMVAGELALGETVGVELRLPWTPDPLRARGLVRHHDRLRCGVEFVGLTPEQRVAIRNWAMRSKGEVETGAAATAELPPVVVKVDDTSGSGASAPPPADSSGPGKRRGPRSVLLVVGAAVLLAGFWWRWNTSWKELESGLPGRSSSSPVEAQARIPAEEMQKLIVHRVDPVYPAAARAENLQGVIALDVVVGRDGTVVEVRPLNGPEVLARAAVEAMRWWKFQPYRVNGQAAAVETTFAMEFRP